MSTIGELVNEVIDELLLPSGGTELITPARVVGYLNRGQTDLAMLTGCYQRVYQVDLVEGQAVYPLPADYHAMASHAPFIQEDSESAPRYYLRFADKALLDFDEPSWRAADGNIPSRVLLDDARSFRVTPPPAQPEDAIWTLNLPIIILPSSLDEAGCVAPFTSDVEGLLASPAIPAGFHGALRDYAIKEMGARYLRDDPLAQAIITFAAEAYARAAFELRAFLRLPVEE